MIEDTCLLEKYVLAQHKEIKSLYKKYLSYEDSESESGKQVIIVENALLESYSDGLIDVEYALVFLRGLIDYWYKLSTHCLRGDEIKMIGTYEDIYDDLQELQSRVELRTEEFLKYMNKTGQEKDNWADDEVFKTTTF